MYKKIKLIAVTTVICVALNSCVLAAVLIGTAAVAGGTVYYVNGNYIIEVPKNIRSVYNATIKTIQMNNEYGLKNQKYSNQSASITATSGSDDISINLKNIDNRSTEIKIRYGLLGNKDKSTNLANQIAKNIT